METELTSEQSEARTAYDAAWLESRLAVIAIQAAERRLKAAIDLQDAITDKFDYLPGSLRMQQRYAAEIKAARVEAGLEG